MSTSEIKTSQSPWRWWGRQRLRYNLILIAAGFVGWWMLAISVWLTQPYVPFDEAGEVTLFTALIQWMAFMIGLVVANGFYFLGPASESWLKPRTPTTYRRWSYWLGTAFSLALILALPVLTAVGTSLFFIDRIALA